MSNNPVTGTLTVAQCAAEVGRPVSTIHNWITTGRLSAHKIGEGRTSAYLIDRAEVERIKGAQATT